MERGINATNFGCVFLLYQQKQRGAPLDRHREQRCGSGDIWCFIHLSSKSFRHHLWNVHHEEELRVNGPAGPELSVCVNGQWEKRYKGHGTKLPRVLTELNLMKRDVNLFFSESHFLENDPICIEWIHS